MNIGQKITLFRIDDCMAMTHRYEFDVRSIIEPPQKVGYEVRKTRVATVRQRGKRKEIYLDLASDDMLFNGWDTPFVTDGEAATGADGHMMGGTVISGNACYNLVGDPCVIRHWIDNQSVFPITDSAKAKIIVANSVRTSCNDDGLELLYPDIDTHHAVIERFKERSEA